MPPDILRRYGAAGGGGRDGKPREWYEAGCLLVRRRAAAGSAVVQVIGRQCHILFAQKLTATVGLTLIEGANFSKLLLKVLWQPSAANVATGVPPKDETLVVLSS